MKHAGLIGYPVAHSLSPRMQQAAFDAYGIEASYLLWETPAEQLPTRIASLRAPEMLGANVTIPHKTAVAQLIDACDPLAARVGAINTIVNRAGQLIGHNTDVHGFIMALAEDAGHLLEGHQKHAVVIGTGGAARAAAVGLMEHRIGKITVLGRTEAHLAALLGHLQDQASPLAQKTKIDGALLAGHDDAPVAALLAQADLLVNATPVGLHENDTQPPVDVAALYRSAVVMDMIFNPSQTPLLQAAQARGCQTLNGLTMLLYQGALAFELWTGLAAPVESMRKALCCS